MAIALAAYALVTSMVLAAGAWLVHGMLRSTVPVRRFVWADAMAAAVLLLALVPLRLRQAAELPAAAEVTAGWFAAATDAPVAVVTGAVRLLPDWMSPALGWAWVLSSLITAAIFLSSYRRHRRRIARADREVIGGRIVRVTERLGPAVVGIWRPDIVVPRWLLERPAAEQLLVVRHESSHVTVGDPLLLVAGCAAVAVMPWNPVMWYLLSRLRLAIELDCDQRVLSDGAPARDYGSLLIDLTALLRRGGMAAPAFACDPSHLERRLLAMTDTPIRTMNRRVRMLTAAGLTVLATLVACQADLPTAAEVQQMDLAAVEKSAPALLRLGTEGSTYLVDGVVVARSVAAALEPSRILSVEVQRTSPAPTIHITTGEARPAIYTKRQSSSLQPTTIVPRSGEVQAPLLVIDGVVSEKATLEDIAPSEIKSVEVLKGQAAKVKYGDRGASGVILLKTKKAP
ncbi:MAG: M56 family metallopeptidase [Gemmatimonadaceae bacterium]